MGRTDRMTSPMMCLYGNISSLKLTCAMCPVWAYDEGISSRFLGKTAVRTSASHGQPLQLGEGGRGMDMHTAKVEKGRGGVVAYMR